MAKKTNYISYELVWLEKRCKQLMQWVEEKLDNGIRDRIEIYEGGRTPIIKVISKEEEQVRTLKDILKELPQMLIDINNLRKTANEEQNSVADVRGGHTVPGFMDDDDTEILQAEMIDENDDPKPLKTKKSAPVKIKKELPPPPDDDDEDTYSSFDDGDFEDP